MAGCDNAIESIEDAFRNGPGDPNLTGIFDGARGAGKTALLTLPADAAEECGWIAACVSAVPGMLEDILVQAGKGRSDDVSRARISSIGTREAGTLGQEEDGRNWRSRLESLLDALEASGTGLLITVDDVRDFDEMVQLASVYQHLVSAGRRIHSLWRAFPLRCRASSMASQSLSFAEPHATVLAVSTTRTCGRLSQGPSKAVAGQSKHMPSKQP
jgi:hypothetical protein